MVGSAMANWLELSAPGDGSRGAESDWGKIVSFVPEQLRDRTPALTGSIADKVPSLELVSVAAKAERARDSFDNVLVALNILPDKLSLEKPTLIRLALKGLLPSDTPAEIKDFAKNIIGLKKNGSDFQITLKEQTHIGNLPLVAAKEVSFKIVQQPDKNTTFTVEDIKGLTVKVPLPEDLLSKLGVKADTAITRLRVGVPDANGNRRISIETDGSVRSVSFEAGADGKPVVKNNKGKEFSEVDVQFKLGASEINCKFSTHIDRNSKQLIIDQVDLKGSHGSKKEILKALGVPEAIAEAGERVSSVVSHDGGFKIYSDGPTNTSVRGLKVRLEEMIFVKATTKDAGDGKAEHEIEVYGLSITGFDFKGDRWERLGSRVANYLGHSDGGLPIRIHKLSIADRNNNQSLITIKETTGALIAAQFLVDKSDPGHLIDGKLLVSNPLNKILPGKGAPPVELSIKNGVVEKPVEAVFTALNGVPLFQYNPIYTGAKLSYRLVEGVPPVSVIKQQIKVTSNLIGHKIETVGQKIDGAAKVVGQKLETGAKIAGNALETSVGWAGKKVSGGMGWIRRKF